MKTVINTPAYNELKRNEITVLVSKERGLLNYRAAQKMSTPELMAMLEADDKKFEADYGIEKSAQDQITLERKQNAEKVDRTEELRAKKSVQAILNNTKLSLPDKIKKLSALSFNMSRKEIAALASCNYSYVYEVQSGKFDKRSFNISLELNGKTFALMGYYKDNKDRTDVIEEGFARALKNESFELFTEGKQADINKVLKPYLLWSVAGLKLLVM